MRYQSYGLDSVKRTQDAGTTERTFFDPWLRELVSGRNFYLCFSNWVASRRTITAFLQQQPIPAIAGDRCMKCNGTAERMHYEICDLHQTPAAMDLGLCPDCLTLAAVYLDKEPQPKPGTQLRLF